MSRVIFQDSRFVLRLEFGGKLRFTHYTTDIQTVGEILANGLAWVPNPRTLIRDLLPSHDFSEREPQEFGMVSFTELPPDHSQGPRKAFGDYGIIVAEEWAASNNIQKVLYIDREGPVFDAFRFLFQYAYEDLRRNSMLREGEISEMAFTNKVRANIARGRIYSYVLQIYEYMEPIQNSYQQEWRIVHPDPLYGYGKTKKEIIDNVSPPKGWAQFLHVLRIAQSDVAGFVCPVRYHEAFQKSLPVEYRNKQVVAIEA